MASPRVTITLGRSGQVVKRGGAVSDDCSADSRPLAGSKRVARDAMYGDVNGGCVTYSMYKRQRLDGIDISQGSNGINDSHLSRHDLRLKLMRKSLSKRVLNAVKERKAMDPHVPRTAQPPVSVNMTHHRHELNDGMDDLLQRTSYSPRTMDGSRAQSPDRVLNTNRLLSPPPNFDEMRQVPMIRTTNATRALQTFTIGVADASRMKYPSSYHAAMYGKSSQMGQGEQPHTVASLLHSLDLGKYTILFQVEEVDMTALRQMGEKDLKELGIPMGPRKKILLALLPQPKRQPP